ncbi:MAG TPA: M56 family metallopeptidase [Sedimentisphaerales bacterium]|nr:M56 family metallopeptidase [Sedimentisphaerales bacterium]
MDVVFEQINSAGQGLVGFALAMLIQSSVVIAVLLPAELLLRKRLRAAVRCRLWMLALMQFFVPVFFLLPVRWEGIAEGEIIWQAGPLTWQGALFLAWLLPAVGIAMIISGRAIRARRLVAGAKEVNNLMRGVLWYCRTCMGVKGEIRLKVSKRLASPAVWGLFRPVILVPHNLAPTLGARHLRSALLHELAHVRRGDLWANLVQTVLQVLYFYNPLLWLANRRIRKVREQAVDEMVVKVMGERGLWYPQARVDVSKLVGARHKAVVGRTNGGRASDTVARRTGRGPHGRSGGNAKSHLLSMVRVVVAFLLAGFGR